jgi:hypothetical protein
VSREAVDACGIPGRHELPPVSGTNYSAFVDPSGGSADSMTLAIAHRERRNLARVERGPYVDEQGGNTCVVLDAVRERRPPFSPEDVTAEFAEVAKRYGCLAVTGDRYGGEWPRERFRRHGVEYRLSESVRSDLYKQLLPLMNSGQVELLDNGRLINQLCALERRTARSGRDSIDHPPRAHEDVANAAAGAVLEAQRRSAVNCGDMVPIGIPNPSPVCVQ